MLLYSELLGTSKKLVLILIISMLVTDGIKKIVRLLCIHYLFQFQENQEQIKTLFNNKIKVNTMSLVYIKKLGFKIRKINIGAQKIGGFTLKTFEIVIADLQIEDKGGRPKFF